MPQEIERKFLLANDGWKDEIGRAITMKQGYLNSDKARTVRVRIAGEQAFLTVKGPVTGVSRPEFEYEIPLSDGMAMMALCEQPVIEKTRYLVESGRHTWEIDVFAGLNEGLEVAEIELGSEAEHFARPDWVGEEVSADSRFFNSSLIANPFSSW